MNEDGEFYVPESCDKTNLQEIVQGFKKLISNSYESWTQPCSNEMFDHEQLLQCIRIFLSELLTLNSKLGRMLNQISSSSSSLVNYLEQLQSSAWENCSEVLRRRIMMMINKCLSKNQMPCHSQLSEAGVEKFVNLIKNLLKGDDDDDELLSISQFTSRRRHGGNQPLIITNTPCQKLLQLYSDFLEYCNLVRPDKRHFVSRLRAIPNFCDLNELKYISSAYLERIDLKFCEETVKQYQKKSLISISERNFQSKLFTMSEKLSINNSLNNDSDSPKVQLCLNKEKSFISFSKCISFEEDVKKVAKMQIIEETEKPSRSRNSDECLALHDLEAIEKISSIPRSKSATNFVVLSLLDSSSGKIIPLQDAINKQIVDHRKSTYRDTVTGSLMSISEAAMKGKAFIRPLEDAQIFFNNKVVDNIVAELKKNPRVTCRLPASPSNFNSNGFKDSVVKSTSHSMKDLEKFVDPQKLSTRSFDFLESSFCFPIGDTTKSNALAIHQALCRGILTFNSITLCRDGGKIEVKSLQEAASLGLMDIEVYEGLLRIAEEHSLDNFIKSSSAKSCKNILESSLDANSDRIYKNIPASQDKSLVMSGDCCLDSLSQLEADTIFVTDLTNQNEVISISAWLTKSQKSSGYPKLQKKTEHVRNTRTQSKNLSNLPLTRATKTSPTTKQTQRNDSKKLPSISPSPRLSNKTQINTQQTKEDASCHKNLGPAALQSLKNALINQKLSAKVFSDENVERVKALKFLKGQKIDIEKDLLMEIKDCTNISCSSKLPKLKNNKTDSKTLAASSSPESKLGSSNSFKSLSVRDAILSGKLDLNTGNLTSGTSSFSIYEPGQSNVKLNEQVIAQILNAVAGSSLGQLLCIDSILPNFNVKSLRDFCPISLERSIKEGLVDPTTVFVFNSNTGVLQSLKAAVKCGSFDLKSSCFVRESGEKININEALASGMIKINFTPSEVQTWLSERRGTADKRICNNNHSVEPSGLNTAQHFWKKCIDDLESIENKLKNWQSHDFDIPMIEDQLKSATDNLIMFVNSKTNPKEVAGKANGKKGCEVEELKARLHKSWEEFENVKLNLKSKQKPLGDWIQDAEERLAILTCPASLDLEVLNLQISNALSLKEEAEKKKPEMSEKSHSAQMTILEKKIGAKLLQLKSLKSCLTSIHRTMDGIDKQIMESNIELRNVLNCNGEPGVNIIDEFLKHHKAIKSIKPSMVELMKCVDELIACSKNKKKKQDAPELKEDLDSSECTSLLPREQLKKLFQEGDQLNVTNENSLASAFVDLHTSYHDFEDNLIEKAVNFAHSQLSNTSEYLEKVENDVREVFVASLDPEVLSQQLADAKSSHEELFSKFSSVQEIADKLGPIIQSPLDDELGHTSEQMNNVCSKLQTVMDFSDAKVEKLEEAVSLAVQLKEMQAEVESALLDVESLVEFVEIPTNGNPEEIKNELESSKLAREALLEQMVLVDALVNKSHDLLELLSLEKCQEQLDQPFLEVRMKFDRLNEQLNDKTNGIIQAWRESTTSLADASESFLEELYKISDAIHLTDPISADVETIKRQINENKALVENLVACSRSMEHLKRMLVQLHATSLPHERSGEDQQIVCDDLANQLNDLEIMHSVAASNVQIRAAKLKEAAAAAEKYEAHFVLTKQKLNQLIESVDLNINTKLDSSEEDEEEVIESEASIGGTHVRTHIQNLMKELSLYGKEVEACELFGDELTRLCEDGAEHKVSRDCASLRELMDELREAILQKKEELDLGEDLTLKFEEQHEKLMMWMQGTEEKLLRLTCSGVASEMRAIKIQIEELKVFMRQLHPHLPDLENINHLVELIAVKTPLHVSFVTRVRALNEMWNRILQTTNEREVALTEALVEVGELDQTMDDVIGHLQQVEADIQTLDEACGDPKYIEAHLKNIEMLLDNVDNQLPSIKKLNERIDSTLLKSCPVDSTPSSTPSSKESTRLLPPSKLSSKLQELNDTYELVRCLARQKKNYLLDCLKEVKDFMKSVEDLSAWLMKYCKQLKIVQLPGALPSTVHNEYQKFMKHHQELERKLDESRMLLFNGEEMKLRCREDQAVDLQLGLVKLEAQACDAVIKSKIEKEKLEDHMKKVQVFHAAMNHHDDWMGGAEKELSVKFKTPSKLLKTVIEQMSEHKDFKEEVTQSQDRVHNLDLTGTYLKYFGSKRDASHVKMQLFGSKSRWKRLVMRTEERGRNLQRAYREDHRFFLSWKELNNWLSDVVTNVEAADQTNIASEVIKKIQLEFPSRQCQLHSTLRQGRHLRDRCTPLDPERKILEEMIEGIKEKWREASRALNLCERRQCERLVESRQVNEACKSLEESMVKFVCELKHEVNLRGDLHTVRTMKDQHITLHEEIGAKKEDIEKLMSLNIIDDVTRLKMQGLIGETEMLWQEKMHLIEESLSLAQRFNDSMMACYEKLSQIEQEVNEVPLNLHVNFSREEKFEVTLEKLMKIEGEVKATETSFREVDVLFHEILSKAQPSSVGSINYCKSLADAQLHKIKKSVAHRRRVSEEGLNKTRRDREVLDDLLAWISDELALLASKENNSIPEDLGTADALFKEHLDFHNELNEKKKVVERFLSLSKKLQATNKQIANPKLVNLNNKWKLIWKVSHDRKKKLQEIFSKLLELRASSHFNFLKWSTKFSSWVSSKKIDVGDLFQLTNHKKDGSLNKKEFIDGLVTLRFQCKPGDMNSAFDELDSSKSGRIHYKEFVQKLNLEPKKLRSQPASEAEQIHKNIEEQLTMCKCQQKYLVNKVSDGKYRFGDKGKLCLVRFLNSTVMVRVGGGWVTLSKYLESNDPCRTKGRSSSEWREKFVLADGVSQARVGFQAKRKSSLTSAVLSGESSQQLQSPSSDASRSPYCSSRHRHDNSGSSTPGGRKTPTSSSIRSRTPDFLGNPSPTSSVHSLSSKPHKTAVADAKSSKVSKIPLSGKTLLNGPRLPSVRSRTTLGTTSVGGSPVPGRNSHLKTSKS